MFTYMIMSLFYVYKITNQVNGKIYVGKSKDPFKRIVAHTLVAETNYKKFNQFQVIHAAIRKHGSQNFIFEIIEACDSEKIVLI
jgi:group I intron endonuclease